jgi:hypothetical protein
MNFNRSSRRDDLLFVIVLLLPVVFAADRYLSSEREMDQIAQAQQRQHTLIAKENKRQADLRLAFSESEPR